MDEFFVGYLPKAPPGIARRVRWAVVLLVLVGLALAVLLATSQKPFAAASFAFGHPTTFTGVVSSSPEPTLWADKPYLLVAPGKHGAHGLVAPHEGKTVTITGALIQRGDEAMIEVESIAPAALPAHLPPPRGKGEEVTLVGEIVDGKCFLGVMRPGEGKAHHDCAVRCISGGTPPLLALYDGRTVVLAGRGGRSLHHEILDVVAEPVEVTGTLSARGEQLILETERGEIRRVSRR